MDNNLLEYKDIQEIVKDYDYDSFMSEEPFELLKTIDDELTRARTQAAMRERAMKCGISAKNFDAMARAALKDKKAEEAEQRRKAAEEKQRENEEEADRKRGTLSGLRDMLDGEPFFGKYICTEREIYYLGFRGEPVPVCGHPLFPTMRYVNVESGSELMDLSYKIDGKWRTKRLIDRKIVSQSRTITALSEFGMDITSENAKEVVRYLAEIDTKNRDIIPRKKTVSHLGWVDGYGFSPYIDGVEYDSSGKYADAYEAVRTEGSFEAWKETAAKVMADRKYLPARILMAGSIASVVLRWTCQQPFMVHMWSTESATGKSVSMMLAASIWANPELGRYVRSMNATKVANEQLAGFCNNLPLFLDELQTVQRGVDFDEIIYMLCEGTGKARGAKDGGLREQARWLNVIITNGEQPISLESRAGAANRVISIETSGAVIPGDMSEFADALRANFGHAGKMVLERIQSVPEFPDKIRGMYAAVKRKLARQVTGKQANYGAALLVGDALLNSIVFSGMGFAPLMTEDIRPYLATQEMVDTNQKAKEWLVGFVASNAAHFRRADESEANALPGDVYGQVENDGSVKIIRSVLKDQMEKRGWTLASFAKWCDDHGMLNTNHSRTNRHWEVWSRINGLKTGTDVLYFRAVLFAEAPVSVEEETPFDG